MKTKPAKPAALPKGTQPRLWQDPSAPSRPGAGAGAGTTSAGPRRCRSLRKPAAGGRALSRNRASPSSGALNRDSPGKRAHTHTPPAPGRPGTSAPLTAHFLRALQQDVLGEAGDLAGERRQAASHLAQGLTQPRAQPAQPRRHRRRSEGSRPRSAPRPAAPAAVSRLPRAKGRPRPLFSSLGRVRAPAAGSVDRSRRPLRQRRAHPPSARRGSAAPPGGSGFCHLDGRHDTPSRNTIDSGRSRLERPRGGDDVYEAAEDAGTVAEPRRGWAGASWRLTRGGRGSVLAS